MSSYIYADLIFEFDNPKDYSEFATGYEALDSEVSSKMIADFIIPDRVDKEFALHLDSSRFSMFIDEVNRHSTTNVDTSNTFVVTTNTPNTRYDEQLYKLFGVSFEKDREKYIYPKKKHILLNPMKALHSVNLSFQSCLAKITDFIKHYHRAILILIGIIALILLAVLVIPKIAGAFGTRITSLENKP